MVTVDIAAFWAFWLFLGFAACTAWLRFRDPAPDLHYYTTNYSILVKNLNRFSCLVLMHELTDDEGHFGANEIFVFLKMFSS